MGYTKYLFDKDFFKKETAESFYVAGFIAADGWIYSPENSNRKRFELGLSLKEEDKSHLEKIQKIIGSNHKLYKRIIKNSKRDPKYNDSVSYTLLISSLDYVKDLEKFNIIPNKSLIYEFPLWLKTHNNVSSFLAGYFDGDGSISFDKKRENGNVRKTPQARLHIRGTKEFLQSFHEIIFDNCDTSIKLKTISKDSGINSLQYTGNKNVHSILNFLYSDELFLQRKYDKFLELQNLIDGNKNVILS